MNATRAVITGASSGIGEAFARILAAEKTHLVLVARRTERLLTLAQELERKFGVQVECLPLDITEPGAAEKLLAFATRDGKTVDLLINNAGAGPYQKFLSVPIEHHTNIIALNTTALTELCHHFGRHMLAQKNRSYILNVASIAAYQASPNFAVYSGTKSYVRVFSEVLNQELKDTNVSVTCLCPEPTQTEFMEKSGQKVKLGQRFFMSATKTAEIGLKATFGSKSVVIPGLMNKLSCWSVRLLPSSWSIRLTGKVMDLSVKAERA